MRITQYFPQSVIALALASSFPMSGYAQDEADVRIKALVS